MHARAMNSADEKCTNCLVPDEQRRGDFVYRELSLSSTQRRQLCIAPGQLAAELLQLKSCRAYLPQCGGADVPCSHCDRPESHGTQRARVLAKQLNLIHTDLIRAAAQRAQQLLGMGVDCSTVLIGFGTVDALQVQVQLRGGSHVWYAALHGQRPLPLILLHASSQCCQDDAMRVLCCSKRFQASLQPM